ncbi:MAG: hypothetical protein ACT7A5_26985 [Ferrovibrionaceae bacterium]
MDALDFTLMAAFTLTVFAALGTLAVTDLVAAFAGDTLAATAALAGEICWAAFAAGALGAEEFSAVFRVSGVATLAAVPAAVAFGLARVSVTTRLLPAWPFASAALASVALASVALANVALAGAGLAARAVLALAGGAFGGTAFAV